MPAARGQAPRFIQCAQFRKEAGRLPQSGFRWCIEQSETCGIGNTRPGAIQPKTRKIRFQDFRPVEGQQPLILRFIPEANGNARLGAPGTAAPLIGGGARHTHGFKPRQAEIRLVTRHTGETGIDDDPHAFDGERGLRDPRCQHDLAPPGGSRPDGGILLPKIERAIKRAEIGI